MLRTKVILLSVSILCHTVLLHANEAQESPLTRLPGDPHTRNSLTAWPPVTLPTPAHLPSASAVAVSPVTLETPKSSLAQTSSSSQELPPSGSRKRSEHPDFTPDDIAHLLTIFAELLDNSKRARAELCVITEKVCSAGESQKAVEEQLKAAMKELEQLSRLKRTVHLFSREFAALNRRFTQAITFTGSENEGEEQGSTDSDQEDDNADISELSDDPEDTSRTTLTVSSWLIFFKSLCKFSDPERLQKLKKHIAAINKLPESKKDTAVCDNLNRSYLELARLEFSVNKDRDAAQG